MKHSKIITLIAGMASVVGLVSCGVNPSIPDESITSSETTSIIENTFGEGISEEEKTIFATLAKGAFSKVDFKANETLLAKYEVEENDKLTTIIYLVKGKTNFIPDGFKVYVGVNVETFKITGIKTLGTLTTHGQDDKFIDNDLGMTGNDGSSFDVVASSTVTSEAINAAAKEAVKAVKADMSTPTPEPDIPEKETYTITFDLNGGTGAFAAEKVESGKVFNRPATDPVKKDYNFIGWFIKGSDEKYDFTKPVTSDINLEARYQSAYTFFRGEILKAPKVGKDGKVVIPSTIDGEEVNALADSLYKGNTDLKEIVIPASVKNIKFSAFEGCTSLTKFSVLSTVDEEGNIIQDLSFGINAFKGCTALTEFHVPARVLTLGTSTFEDCSSLKSVKFISQIDISNDLFKNCTSLKEVMFAKGEKAITIGQRAFKDCTSLSILTNFDTVKTLQQEAFAGCSGLTSLHFGKEFKDFGIACLKGCTNLKEISVHSENKNFKVEDNALYNSSLSSLKYVCPTEKTFYEFPKTTTSYEASAFINCSNLKEFRVAEGNKKYTARDGLLFELPYYGNEVTLKDIPTGFEGAIQLLENEKYSTSLVLGKIKGITTFDVSSKQANTYKKVDGILYYASYSYSTKEYTPTKVIFVDRTVTGTVKLPNTIESIEEYAFSYSNVENLVITSELVSGGNKEAVEADIDAFINVKENFKIYVPDGYVTTYELQWNLVNKVNELGLKYLQKTPYVEPEA